VPGRGGKHLILINIGARTKRFPLLLRLIKYKQFLKKDDILLIINDFTEIF
jgi:hypothetical protein